MLGRPVVVAAEAAMVAAGVVVAGRATAAPVVVMVAVKPGTATETRIPAGVRRDLKATGTRPTALRPAQLRASSAASMRRMPRQRPSVARRRTRESARLRRTRPL